MIFLTAREVIGLVRDVHHADFSIDTKKLMLQGIGRRHNIAMHLNWKLGVSGTMQGTTMFTV